jgi:hypothetical protein
MVLCQDIENKKYFQKISDNVFKVEIGENRGLPLLVRNKFLSSLKGGNGGIESRITKYFTSFHS